ncbi:hypothetical protein KC345_g11282, partial [Hortaea werneckii]
MDNVGGLMNNVKLSDRLQLLLEQVPEGSRLADIGSDHALLPVAAVESLRVPSAIAGEVNLGPFEAARRGVAEAGLSRQITVRRGDGLEVLEPGEADCITIAGMGGSLIAAILERGQKLGKLAGVKTLALQPNVGEDILRRWLLANGWLLISEHILEEDGKTYEILTAVPEGEAADRTNEQLYRELVLAGGKVALDQAMLLQMGPWLLQAPNEVFMAKWQGEIAKLEGILTSLSRSELEAAEEKRSKITLQIKRIAELAPKHLAEEWDNVGLQLGSLQKEITGVLVALDVNDSIVDEAIAQHCNLIIAHHAVIFKPIKGILTDTPMGRLYEKLIKNDIAVYISHTNL